MESLRVTVIIPGIALAAGLLAGCAVSHPDAPAGFERDQLGAYYQAAAGVAATPVSDFGLYDGGPAIKAEMLRLTKLAKDHILVGSFLLTDGPDSREVLDALAEKAAEGVRVQVIGDASSRFVPEEQAFDYLAGRDVAVAEFNPVRGWRLALSPVLLVRDHRKFWIVDGRWVFLGGANVNDPSLAAPEAGGNRDLMVTIDSPVAARQLTSSFVKTWNASDGPGLLDEAAFAPGSGTAPAGGDFWVFNQEEIPHYPSLTAVMMEGLFASARRSIWLVEPYAFVNCGILDHIRAMADRGVEVNVILSSQARAPRFRYAAFYGIKDLTEAGARVWIFDSEVSPLHYKCALVDDELAYVGSSNLNFRSYFLSRELNVVFDDAARVKDVRAVIDSVRKDCREATREEARKYRSLPFLTWWLIMQAAG